MSDSVEIVKPIHTVMEFTDMIDQYHGANNRTANNGKFSWKNEFEDILFYYVLLGNDAVVWDQRVTVLQDQNISLVASQTQEQNYMFTYFLEANKSIHVESGQIFNKKSLVFSNDQGSYRFTMSKGFKGHILQIILSDAFIRNYVSPKYLNHSLIDSVVNKSGPDLLLLTSVPSYLHSELLKIAERMGEEGAGIERKLSMLQSLAHFLDVFFRDYLGQEKEYSQSGFDKQFKKNVQALIIKNKFETFWGVSYYADQLGLSTSSFKRQFEKYFKTTPLNHFKNTQLKYAKTQLETGRYSVTDIAYKLGYSSNANFVRSYKKYMGNTPSQDIQKQ